MQADVRAVMSGRQTQRRYTSIGGVAAALVKQHGVTGLWRGGLPAVQRAALINLGELSTYDEVSLLGWVGDAREFGGSEPSGGTLEQHRCSRNEALQPDGSESCCRQRRRVALQGVSPFTCKVYMCAAAAASGTHSTACRPSKPSHSQACCPQGCRHT